MRRFRSRSRSRRRFKRRAGRHRRRTFRRHIRRLRGFRRRFRRGRRFGRSDVTSAGTGVRYGRSRGPSLRFKRAVRDAASEVTLFNASGNFYYNWTNNAAVFSPLFIGDNTVNSGGGIYYQNMLGSPADVIGMAQTMQVTGAGNSWRMMVTEQLLNVTFTNNTTGTVYIELYFVEPRRDIPWIHTSSTHPFYNYANIFTRGMADVFGGSSFTDPSYTYFQSPSWTTAFKCIKVKKYQLLPGEQKLMRQVDRRRHILSSERFAPNYSVSGISLLSIRGFSHPVYVKMYGGGVVDSVTNTNVGFSVGKVLATWTKRYRAKLVFDFNTEGLATSGFDTVSTGQTVNPLTGAGPSSVSVV